LLQEVNNLKYVNPDTGVECRLADNPQQYELLLDKLSTTKEMTFDQIRKELGFLESVRFNLEEGKRTKLKGMVSDALLAGTKLFGKSWYKRSETERDEIVLALTDPERNEVEVLRLAVEQWRLDPETADRLLDVDLPSGYLHLSRKALAKLVPPMRRGLLYMTDDGQPSALSEAGYLRPDQRQRRVHEFLPEPPTLTNPIVRQAIFEVRKVVNAILREYGKPAAIHIELARDAKATSEERKKINQQMRDREALRDDAAGQVREHGVKVTRDAIGRYLLWQEQRSLCPYSGEIISVGQLFGGEVDVDHILPKSKTLDDSMPNKSL
jgi:CRISPR-associated endonuclease Csn1